MAGPPALCVVLHDVAPARWAACLRVLAQLRAVAARAGVALPLSLLVVPCLHGRSETPAPYLRWLQRLQRDGHELVLHGWTHHDDSPPGSGPGALRSQLLRRVYTDGEGEFAAIDGPGATRRLDQGLQWARRHGLVVGGFVPPAWLPSGAAWQALAAQPLGYTCTLRHLVRLPQCQRLRAPALVFSTRSAWRRQASVVWNRLVALQAMHGRPAPLLRLELHPHDADHAAVRRCWSGLLLRALQQRQPLTLAQAVARQWPVDDAPGAAVQATGAGAAAPPLRRASPVQ